jgi:hypothetical protein
VIINYTSNLTPAGGGESEASQYVLDEVVAKATFDSDKKEVKRILLDAAKKATARIIRSGRSRIRSERSPP